jgi:hypothetical protein
VGFQALSPHGRLGSAQSSGGIPARWPKMDHVTFELRDDLYDEIQGEFQTFSEAVAQACRLAAIPWDAPPNPAPCTSRANCSRNDEIVEQLASDGARQVVDHTSILENGAAGAHW